MFMASVMRARTVSERFFFAFSHSACSGSSQMLTFCVFRSAAIEILHIRAQHFGDAPGLRDAAARGVRRIAVEDFRDRADAGFAEVAAHRLERGPTLLAAALA